MAIDCMNSLALPIGGPGWLFPRKPPSFARREFDGQRKLYKILVINIEYERLYFPFNLRGYP